MEDCIFCKIVKGEIPSFKVYENDKVFAFEDINPVSLGHTLIIPKKHTENIWEIPPEDLSAINMASQKSAREVNQVVMHYHLHLIPRSGNTPELPMTIWELKQGDMDEIKKAAEKILAALE